MNLASAPNKARSVAGVKTPARLYNEIEHELELGAGGSQDDYEAGEEALQILRNRFPDVERRARDITEPPKLSRKAADRLAGEGEKLRREEQRRPIPGGPRQRGETHTRRPQGRTTRRAAGRRRYRSSSGTYLGQTGLPQRAQTASQMIFWTIGGIVSLVLLGMLVSDRGSGAITAGEGLLGKALNTVGNPAVDPLAGAKPSSPAVGPRLAQSAATPPPRPPVVKPGQRVPKRGGIGHRNVA